MSINRKASFGIIYPVINIPGNGFPGASVGPLAGKKQDSHAILYNGLNWLNGCLGFDVGAGIVPISAKLFFAEKAEKMNIEHRTSNVQHRIRYSVELQKGLGKTEQLPFDILRFA